MMNCLRLLLWLRFVPSAYILDWERRAFSSRSLKWSSASDWLWGPGGKDGGGLGKPGFESGCLGGGQVGFGFGDHRLP